MTVFSSLSLFIRGAHYVMDFDSWFSKAKFLNSNDETQSDFLIRPTWTGRSNLTNCLNTGYPYSWWLPILFQNDSFILCSLKGNFPSAAGSKSEAYIFLEENIRSFWATIPPPYLETANEFLILFNVDSNTHHFFEWDTSISVGRFCIFADLAQISFQGLLAYFTYIWLMLPICKQTKMTWNCKLKKGSGHILFNLLKLPSLYLILTLPTNDLAHYTLHI